MINHQFNSCSYATISTSHAALSTLLSLCFEYTSAIFGMHGRFHTAPHPSQVIAKFPPSHSLIKAFSSTPVHRYPKHIMRLDIQEKHRYKNLFRAHVCFLYRLLRVRESRKWSSSVAYTGIKTSGRTIARVAGARHEYRTDSIK